MTLTLVGDPAAAFEAAGDKVTADGTWTHTHEQDRDGAPLVVATHLATGLARTFPTLDTAEAWTGSGHAIADLISDAYDELEGLTFPEAKAQARAALTAFGVLLPATVEVEHRCGCGGYLAYGPGRVLRHVDTCVDEVEGLDCDVDGHTVCRTPEAVQCDHIQCHAPNRVFTRPCEHGHDSCSGCCHGED